MMKRRQVLAGASAAAVVAAGGYALLGGPDYEAVAAATWQPADPAAPEIGRLVHYATLAANSHNTQPWIFEAGSGPIRILPDTTRRTPVADPDDHHLFATLGCAAENLMLAAGAEGKASALSFGADGAIAVDLAPGGAEDPLFAAITARQCSRSLYDGSTVSAADLSLLERAAQVDGCRVLLVTEPAEVAAILDLILAANAVQIADPAFVAELGDWLRFSAAAAVDTGDGLFSACSGNPTMPQWIGQRMFPRVFTPEAENEKTAAQVRSSAGLAIFVSDRDDAEHWVAAGRSYQRFALQATALDLKTAFLNQPLEVPEYRPQLAGLLGVTDRRPDLLVRFGRGPAMPRSLRRPVADVMRMV
ncbi:Tat pathway signal protein [Thalassococcus sp. CAU 1522]|uniref:Tat pathway signal protein n=1 Tax=Thalassococcus arenae TaxID=2851652 RepID=A0ABS6NB76_9RHOB|nr:Tat pathway signal protein [Thalassococcus arenae]MBV2360834.1 Tat pathway signal protein [Thalassococcus arenae]